jgi:hypothetical protein
MMGREDEVLRRCPEHPASAPILAMTPRDLQMVQTRLGILREAPTRFGEGGLLLR